ncbi:MAG: hypothetical protein J6V68_04120 [Clostridia bacterium]|nr:hypothetical protein [Clostridia bacterium]
MKKTISLFLTLLFALTLIVSAPNQVLATFYDGNDIRIDRPNENLACGQKIIYFGADSDISNNFNCYSSIGQMPYVQDGEVICIPNADQQKIVSKTTYTGDIDISVDIRPLANSMVLDAGLIIGGSNASNPTDKITAYTLVVSKSSNSAKYKVILQRKNQVHIGNLVSSSDITYNGKEIKLRAVVKRNVLYAFSDGNFLFTCDLSDYNGGAVGLMQYYSAVAFDNFKVLSSSISLDKTKLNSLITRFNSLTKSQWIESQYNSLQTKITAVSSFKYTSQTQIDEDIVIIEKMFSNLKKSYTKEQLTTLTNQCRALSASYFSTENAYSSMQRLISRADSVSSTNLVEISSLYTSMETLKNSNGG